MDTDFTLLQNLVPDVLKIFRQRYQVLEQISLRYPVGRRAVAQQLGISERTVRTETEYLKKLGLIEIKPFGMYLTEKGEETLKDATSLINRLFNASQAEIKLAKKLKIARAIIVPGDADLQERVSILMGEKLNSALDLLLPLGSSIITVLGGATLAKASKVLSSSLSKNRELEFVPGRGALGESVETQSSTIVQEMAKATGGKYKTLYLPENVSKDAYRSLIRDPAISDVLQDISQCDVAIHGIGLAEDMAKRRGYDSVALSRIRATGAVSECFGCFFDENGKMIERIPRIGLQFEDLSKIPHIFAFAGGHSKAKAISSYMHNAPSQTWLITDEGASDLILKGQQGSL